MVAAEDDHDPREGEVDGCGEQCGGEGQRDEVAGLVSKRTLCFCVIGDWEGIRTRGNCSSERGLRSA